MSGLFFVLNTLGIAISSVRQLKKYSFGRVLRIQLFRSGLLVFVAYLIDLFLWGGLMNTHVARGYRAVRPVDDWGAEFGLVAVSWFVIANIGFTSMVVTLIHLPMLSRGWSITKQGWALGGVAAGNLAKSDADDRWLNDWTQKTRGAAALWALMDCGIVDALPDRDCPGLSSAELIAAARETTERAPAADAADAVARLLRHLALLKFCDESPTWRFRHSARSRAFVDDGLARSRALSNLSPALVRPWWRVSEALQQNEAPFALEHGGSACENVG